MSKVNLSEKTSTEAIDEQTPLILNIEYESDGQVEPAQDDSAAPLAGEEKPSDLEPLESDKTPTNLTPQPTPKASSTPRTSDTTIESARISLDGLTEEQLLELQVSSIAHNQGHAWLICMSWFLHDANDAEFSFKWKRLPV